MVYKKVGHKEFEKYLKKVDQTNLQKNRDYSKKICFLDKDKKSGFSLTVDGALCHVFSLVKGRGKVAVAEAIKMGANRLSCFGDNLKKYYENFGFHVTLVEPQNNGVEKNWMCLKENMKYNVITSLLVANEHKRPHLYRNYKKKGA